MVVAVAVCKAVRTRSSRGFAAQVAAVSACVSRALDGPGLAPYVPDELTESAYADRMERLFGS